MARNEPQTAGPSGIQIFELIMDNPEDQGELNRRLYKQGEPSKSPSPLLGRSAKDPLSSASAEETNQTTA